jgi:hypothetical protein
VKEFVARMIADFGANLERQLAHGRGAARASEVDALSVLWGWFKSLFARRESP